MDKNQRNYKGLVEINDILNDAINNAVARRSQADALTTLSNEEAARVAGGIGITIPITIGIVAPPPPNIC